MSNNNNGSYRNHRAKSDTQSFDPVRKPASSSQPAKRRTSSSASGSGNGTKRKGEASPFVKTFAYVICVFAASILIATFAILVGNDFLGLLKTEGDITITTPTEMSVDQLADILKENGVIKYKFVFKIFASMTDKDTTQYKAKNYLMNTNMGYTEVFLTLRRGTAQKDTVMVTIPEGKEQREIAQILEDAKVCTAAEFMAACNDTKHSYGFLEDVPKRENMLEGYLFPDTYEFYVGDSPQNVIQRFLDNFESKYSEAMLKATEEKGLTIDEVVTLASIIEREAANESDRGTVASVFWNRLSSKSYPYLESCATVQYVLEERKSILSRADTEIESPYNTYLNKGLPVGPIASPGLASLKAVLQPETTDYLFFVVNEEGKHIFSKTYEEHLNAIKEARSSQGTGVVGE